MSTPVTLPALGESVTEGTVVRWFKQVGEDVVFDEPLLEVSTDKVDTEIPSPATGVLLEITVAEDETIEVGTQLAVIGAVAPAVAPIVAPTPPGGPAPAVAAPPAAPHPTPTAAPNPTAVRVQSWSVVTRADGGLTRVAPTAGGYLSPLVRRMVAELGIEPAALRGTGGGGRVRKQDVIAAAEARRSPATDPTPVRPVVHTPDKQLSAHGRETVNAVSGSFETSASTQVVEVDMTRVARLYDKVKADFGAREGVALTYLAFFARAAIDALRRHPKLNAQVDATTGEVSRLTGLHVAFAVDTPGGSHRPVVRDAGDLSIAGLARRISDVADRSRTRTITAEDCVGGTFSITDPGSYGALFDSPVITRPQVAAFGPGMVVKRAVVMDDPDLGETIAVRHMVYLSLSYDQRFVDGVDAGRFLSDVRTRLEAAEFDV